MVVALLLLASMGPQPGQAPSRIAGTRPSLQGEADRTAIDAAVTHRVIGSGYFRLVAGKAEQRLVIAEFEKRLRSTGIPITIDKCEWIGLVAEGVKGGNLSYGGACRVRIASRPPADFLVCEATLGSISLTKPDWFASDLDYIELFIRRSCF